MQEILNFHNDIKPILTKELRERSKGRFEGKPSKERNEVVAKKKIPYYQFDHEGGETLQDTQERVIKFYKQIKKQHEEDTVLFVSHGETITGLLTFLHNKPLEEYKNFIPRKNTALSIIDIRKTPVFEVLNSAEHLNN